MANDFDSVNTVCPYYVTEDRCSIRCEGCMSYAEHRTRWETMAAKIAHKTRYCNSIDGYPTCPLSAAITAHLQAM